VQEITVDGQTVFTAAAALPVAYSNLVAWYPFDSSFYGGSNADDCTALFNPGQSGDSTAYDGTVNGATYQSSGGVEDINAGANSGAFDFDGSNDYIDVGKPPVAGESDITWTANVKFDNVSTGSRQDIFGTGKADIEVEEDGGTLDFYIKNASGTAVRASVSVTAGSFINLAGTYDGSSMKLYKDGSLSDTQSQTGNIRNSNEDLYLGAMGPDNERHLDGTLDDVRFYNTALSSSQINQIYQNTQP